MSYRDRDDTGNSWNYHTGKKCVEKGCENPAGTAWSDHWCFECNVKRIDRITKNLDDIATRFRAQDPPMVRRRK